MVDLVAYKKACREPSPSFRDKASDDNDVPQDHGSWLGGVFTQ